MGEVIHINARRQGVSSTCTASNHNEMFPRMADAFISQYPEYRQIPLTKGYVAIIDAANYEWLSQWKWYALVTPRSVYAQRKAPIVKGMPSEAILMHRQIMSTPRGMHTDHRNGNGLMNIYENLRVCTNAENHRNERLRTGESSIYKGVSWSKWAKKWRAVIRHNGKLMHLGYFTTEIEAAIAYNKAAQEYFGEFALLNIIEPHPLGEAA